LVWAGHFEIILAIGLENDGSTGVLRIIAVVFILFFFVAGRSRTGCSIDGSFARRMKLARPIITMRRLAVEIQNLLKGIAASRPPHLRTVHEFTFMQVSVALEGDQGWVYDGPGRADKFGPDRLDHLRAFDIHGMLRLRRSTWRRGYATIR
jgi:hypothetical protein